MNSLKLEDIRPSNLTGADKPKRSRAKRSYIDLDYARFPARGGFLDQRSYRVSRYADLG